MITVITGLTGSGKTWFMTRLIYKEWKAGAVINTNFPIYFSKDNEDINRWHQLDEIYRISNGIIAIDEGQKLFDARRWGSLPISFAEKIAQHRKHFLDIYTTTQDIGHIDVRVRTNIHELYHCQSIFRFPKNERKHPLFQLIIISKKKRSFNVEDRLVWEKAGRKKIFFISSLWTKTLYNTYADIGMERFLCKIKYEQKLGQKKGKWLVKIYSRDLINQGKARL
jgi:hypothetical protein